MLECCHIVLCVTSRKIAFLSICSVRGTSNDYITQAMICKYRAPKRKGRVTRHTPFSQRANSRPGTRLIPRWDVERRWVVSPPCILCSLQLHLDKNHKNDKLPGQPQLEIVCINDFISRFYGSYLRYSVPTESENLVPKSGMTQKLWPRLKVCFLAHRRDNVLPAAVCRRPGC